MTGFPAGVMPIHCSARDRRDRGRLSLAASILRAVGTVIFVQGFTAVNSFFLFSRVGTFALKQIRCSYGGPVPSPPAEL
jgi:hypothetical protein